MTALPARDAIVATAGESIARGSLSFAMASRLFGRRARERAWLLYAWARACDDLADGQDHGHGMTVVADPEARLAVIRERTAAALAGEWVGDAPFDALRMFVAETGAPHRLVWDVIEGFALDAAGWRPETPDDLYRYCYHVAGAIGCLMAVAMGVSPEDEAVLDRACDLGIAFQIGNIARDIEEDARAGRCYLPREWRGPDRGALLAERAGAYAASGRAGTPALPFRSAWAVLAAARIYGGIAQKVAALGDRAWDKRVRTGTGEKLMAIIAAFGEALDRRRRFPPVSRETLWTRPR